MNRTLFTTLVLVTSTLGLFAGCHLADLFYTTTIGTSETYQQEMTNSSEEKKATSFYDVSTQRYTDPEISLGEAAAELEMYQRYNRVPIFPPIAAGDCDSEANPPTDEQVMRVLETIDPVEGNPMLRAIENVILQKEEIMNKVDPPKIYPIIGPAQLHHSRWKCTVYYTRTKRVDTPMPNTLIEEDAKQVVYIDQEYFHQIDDCTARE